MIYTQLAKWDGCWYFSDNGKCVYHASDESLWVSRIEGDNKDTVKYFYTLEDAFAWLLED